MDQEKLLKVVLGVTAIVFVGLYLQEYVFPEKDNRTITEKAVELRPDSFTLEGEVFAIVNNRIHFRTQVITPNSALYKDKEAVMFDYTKYKIAENIDGDMSIRDGSLADVVIGSKIVVHTTDFAYDDKALDATQVDIIR